MRKIIRLDGVGSIIGAPKQRCKKEYKTIMDAIILGEKTYADVKCIARLYANDQIWVQFISIPHRSDDVVMEEFITPEQLDEYVQVSDIGKKLLEKRRLL
jgi:hypothetical protein